VIALNPEDAYQRNLTSAPASDCLQVLRTHDCAQTSARGKSTVIISDASKLDLVSPARSQCRLHGLSGPKRRTQVTLSCVYRYPTGLLQDVAQLARLRFDSPDRLFGPSGDQHTVINRQSAARDQRSRAISLTQILLRVSER